MPIHFLPVCVRISSYQFKLLPTSDISFASLTILPQRILHIIQRQPTKHITTIIRPRNTKPHTLQPLEFLRKTRMIHFEIRSDMAGSKSGESDNAV